MREDGEDDGEGDGEAKEDKADVRGRFGIAVASSKV